MRKYSVFSAQSGIPGAKMAVFAPPSPLFRHRGAKTGRFAPRFFPLRAPGTPPVTFWPINATSAVLEHAAGRIPPGFCDLRRARTPYARLFFFIPVSVGNTSTLISLDRMYIFFLF